MSDALDEVPPLENGLVRFVVVSDVHAVTSGPGAIVAEDTAADATANALSAATALFAARSLKADVLACPGDLIDVGNSAPLDWVWSELQQMAIVLDARLVATVGNHDLVRAPAPGADPQAALRNLQPRFPGLPPPDSTKFWGDGFASCRAADGRWRLVTVDTCQLVGYHPSNEQWGMLRGDTLPLLEDFLATDVSAPINVLMCHHQPQEWTHANDENTSHLQRGDLLLDLLDARPERWMVLHGHKHEPVLDYFGNGTGGSVRLAAASVGANLTAKPNITNQLHVVDFHPQARASGLPLAGEVHSIDWHPGYGWAPATVRSGLTHRAGFGFRRDGAEFAWWLHSKFGSSSLDWATVAAREPRVRYLAPKDLQAIVDAVKAPLGAPSGTVAGSARLNRDTGHIEELTLP